MKLHLFKLAPEAPKAILSLLIRPPPDCMPLSANRLETKQRKRARIAPHPETSFVPCPVIRRER
ncbi:hypothetical protein F506_18860 [Herbaspirillum hiltneri N3]|uniref:Uncharacterized protein n=1 Tax=Herbaspirillum hiltneri N3 TaxID=1262470 RepID=A0ABN4I6D0_9BURK|nr:hypothetical protein F506_18860 [Herbaspirillum hiltneri N3]